MSYSFYEIYITAQRAFTAMGFPYGSDEDAAFIIAWLELNNFQGSHWAPHLIHIETWNKVGGLSEEFFGAGSDPDLCIKLWKQGTRIFKGLSDFRVYHFSSIVSNKVDNSKRRGTRIFIKKWISLIVFCQRI